MSNHESLKKLFTSCKTPEERYELIIDFGQKLTLMPTQLKNEDNLVPGCQSKLYLSYTFEEGLLYFKADSDALISKGLAALLLYLYNGTSPEYLLRNPPHIITELSLSPTRATGVGSLYTKMQKIALQHLV